MPARHLAILSLALLAAPLAAKPGAPPGPAEARYRTVAVALCVRQLGTAEGADPGEVEALCGCAADRFIAGRDAAALSALDPAGMPSAFGSEVLGCLSEIRPAAAGTLAAAAMRPPPSSSAPAEPAAAPDKPAAGEEAAAPAGPGLMDRIGSAFDRLSFSSLPRWAWGLIALASLLFLRRLFRRPERDDDLMGPPRPDRYRNLPRY